MHYVLFLIEKQYFFKYVFYFPVCYPIEKMNQMIAISIKHFAIGSVFILNPSSSISTDPLWLFPIVVKRLSLLFLCLDCDDIKWYPLLILSNGSSFACLFLANVFFILTYYCILLSVLNSLNYDFFYINLEPNNSFCSSISLFILFKLIITNSYFFVNGVERYDDD